MKVTAKVQRSGQWWAVHVPEVDGAFTQARKLDEVADIVRDAVSLLEDVPVGDIDVDVPFDLGDDLGARIAHARQAVTEARLPRNRLRDCLATSLQPSARTDSPLPTSAPCSESPLSACPTRAYTQDDHVRAHRIHRFRESLMTITVDRLPLTGPTPLSAEDSSPRS